MRVPYRLDRPGIMSLEGTYRPLAVGICQIETHPWDFEGNLERLRDALRTAAGLGVRYAITPECVLHGYADMQQEGALELLEQQAQPIDGPVVKDLRSLVASLGITATIGFAEKSPSGAFHNTALTIDTTGKIIDTYRKVHLRPFEDILYDGYFTAGESFGRFEVEGSAIGTCICFDREIPESIRCLRSLGAQLVACPLATDTDDAYAHHMNNEIVTRVRSAENEVCIAVVNHARRFNGGSFVTGPDGSMLLKLDSQPQVRRIELPLGAVEEVYHGSGLGWMGYGYRRPEVYTKYL